ncbi:MAG: outer-membrane lipoprotein carrier protein LolA [Endomicrobiia bacterium]
MKKFPYVLIFIFLLNCINFIHSVEISIEGTSKSAINIACVDMERLFKEYPKVEQSKKEYETLKKEKQSELEEKEKAIYNLQFNFAQTVYFDIVKETHSVSGKLVFKKPNKIYYQIPNQLIISDGKKMWIHNIETNQVFVDFWKNWKGINYFIPGLFNPKGKITDLKKVYKFGLYKEDEENYVLLLIPKEKVKTSLDIPPGEKFEFYLWISKKDLYPIKSRFVSENIVCDTEISNYEINTGVKDEIFEYKIPEGSEVIRLFK